MEKHVWARPGHQVRNPTTNLPIPEEGAPIEAAVAVTLDSYWQRRMADGAVVVTEIPKPKKGDA